MTTYILLRNNKESAPCSLDDLRNLGLKAGDQVWVEGQSVCWLSPLQVPELKNLVGQPALVAEIPQIVPVSTQEQKSEGHTRAKAEPRIQPQYKKAGLYAGLILLGVIAGVMIKKTGAQKDPSLNGVITKSVPNEIPTGSTAATDSATLNFPDPASQALLDQQQQALIDANSKQIKKPETKTGEAPLTAPVTTNETISSPVTETAAVTEMKKEEEKPVKKISVNEVRSQVSVKTNDYSVGSFGGIKNLKVTITNNSKYELDKVAVEIEYLKPLNEFIRSETVSVQSLGPGETKVIEIKNSNRGVKVNCKVGSIHSRDFSDDTAGLL